jgi:5'-3' exonuclease
MRQVVKKTRADNNKIKPTDSVYSILVDGNSLLKISLVDKRMNNNGQEYGAIYNFLRLLGNILSKKDFNHCTVCWDGLNSGILRYNIYPDYKANRDKHYNLLSSATDYDKQISDYCKKVLNYHKGKVTDTVRGETDDESFQRQRTILMDILDNLYIRQFIYDDVEGDDLIANYVHNKKPNEKIVIVSGDRDIVQLIDEDVCVYIPSLKKFVTCDNCLDLLGYRHDNIIIKKMICGDVSDNIKGIKGIGEPTLNKLFPEMLTEKVDLDFIMRRSREQLDSRKAEKKKPLKSLENIINGVTDGCQGDRIYEINRKIIDLSEPMLTEEASSGMENEMYAPIDDEDRNITNVYNIILENDMNDLMDESKFGSVFGNYNRIITKEREYFKKNK